MPPFSGNPIRTASSAWGVRKQSSMIRENSSRQYNMTGISIIHCARATHLRPSLFDHGISRFFQAETTVAVGKRKMRKARKYWLICAQSTNRSMGIDQAHVTRQRSSQFFRLLKRKTGNSRLSNRGTMNALRISNGVLPSVLSVQPIRSRRVPGPPGSGNRDQAAVSGRTEPFFVAAV